MKNKGANGEKQINFFTVFSTRFFFQFDLKSILLLARFINLQYKLSSPRFLLG